MMVSSQLNLPRFLPTVGKIDANQGCPEGAASIPLRRGNKEAPAERPDRGRTPPARRSNEMLYAQAKRHLSRWPD